MTPEAREATTRKVWSIVDALPHREAIVEGDARHWVPEVVERYGELATWHAVRAGGFGGSQIGALVRNRAGQRADHGASAHDIVELCLLRRLPDEPNGQMARGVWMEPHHRQFFLEKYSAWRDERGLQVLSSSNGSRMWMRYSPDELCFMPVLGGVVAPKGQPFRVLGDYKAPTEVEQAQSIAFQYGCQLHMGRLVCEHNGVKVDGMVLSQFRWADWSLKDDFVPHTPQLDELILDAGDHYWEFVLRGQVPPYVRKAKLDPSIVTEEVHKLAERVAKLKAICSALEQQIDQGSAELKELLKGVRFDGGKLQLASGALTVTAAPKFDDEKLRAAGVPESLLASVPLKGNATKRYDEKKLLEALRAREVDTKQFLLPNNLDADALYNCLLDAGFDADGLMTEVPRTSVSDNLKAEADAWFRRELPDLVVIRELDPADAQGSPNDRDGQEAQRSVPRSVSA